MPHRTLPGQTPESRKPAIKVLQTSAESDYNKALYRCVADSRLAVQDLPSGFPITRWRNLLSRIRDVDVLHVGWPEYLFATKGLREEDYWRGLDGFLAELADLPTKVVLTLHNQRPHYWSPAQGKRLMECWAPQVDLALHHSRWGLDLMKRLYPFSPGCRHEVLFHPHFGMQMDVRGDRVELERRFRLPPTRLRLGVLGRYQLEKQVEMILSAFLASALPDAQVLLTAYAPGLSLPKDPRILPLPRGPWMERADIGAHIALCDALVAAPSGDSYLTSGTIGDALAGPTAMVVPRWSFFEEVVGPGGIYHGNTVDSLAEVLSTLRPELLQEKCRILKELQAATTPLVLAPRLADLLLEACG